MKPERIAELRSWFADEYSEHHSLVTIDTPDFFALLDAAERANRLEEALETIKHNTGGKPHQIASAALAGLPFEVAKKVKARKALEGAQG